MVLVNPPNVQSEYKKNKTIKISGPKAKAKAKKKAATKPKRGAKKATSRGSQTPNPPRTDSLQFPGIDQTDGGNN
jgi:hypothetical protein